MIIPMTVHSESVDEYKGKNGLVKSRRVMLLDASPGQRLAQVVELNLPEEHAAIGQGKTVQVEITEISAIFAGRPRIRGNILPAGKNA